MNQTPGRASAVTAGVLLGAGLGGFLDGIFLHQILQWHMMLSSRIPPTDIPRMKYNMLWDGVFHAAMWIATAAGVARLWQSVARGEAAPSGRTLMGAMLLGWGGFNVIEGIVNHQLLGLHHVRPGPTEVAWDTAYIAVSLVLALAGRSLLREGRSAAA